MSHAVDMEQQEYAWHSKTVEEVERLQETDMQNGLTSAEAERRLEAYGKNELPGKPKVPFWVKLWGQLKNILIAILAVAAVVLAIVEEFTEVGLICAVVVINVTIGLVQEGKAEAAAEAIKGMLAGKAVVIRDGAAKTIAANEVVPGDICVVTAGDQVPADLRFFQAANIRCAEDALTGESNPVAKHVNPIEGEGRVGLGDRKNCAYSATNVQSGKGTGIVIATGDKAQIGQINAMVNEASEQKKMTNLEWQLEMFGRYVGVFTMVVAAVTFAVSLEVAGEDVGTAFKSAVSIAVAIIPEGLPAVVTISLALAMKYLAENNAIVKKLPAVETLGSVTVICSDKTGTLTKNEMTVQKVQTTSGQYPVKGVGYDPNLGTVCNPETGQPIEAKHMKQMLKMFEGIVLCNDATLKKAEMKSGNWIWQLDAGVPTEGAMCTLGLKMGCAGAGVDLDPEQILLYRKQKPRIAAVPFASEHKFMCCFHRYDEPDQKGIIMHVKGAPDRLLPRCKSQIIDDDLTKSEPIVTRFWEDKAAEMSAQGLRVLAVAIAPYDESKLTEEMTADVLLKAPAPFMTLIGLVAILDPPREDAIVACGKAKKAGITVKMITGDHPETAVAIAKQLGIVDPKIDSSKVVKIAGPELDKMLEEKGEAALDKFVMSCNVFARSSPANKISIVESLKRVGQTPSMTGVA
jgi:potassium/sodium efflux P-type ATPase